MGNSAPAHRRTDGCQQNDAARYCRGAEEAEASWSSKGSISTRAPWSAELRGTSPPFPEATSACFVLCRTRPAGRRGELSGSRRRQARGRLGIGSQPGRRSCRPVPAADARTAATPGRTDARGRRRRCRSRARSRAAAPIARRRPGRHQRLGALRLLGAGARGFGEMLAARGTLGRFFLLVLPSLPFASITVASTCWRAANRPASRAASRPLGLSST